MYGRRFEEEMSREYYEADNNYREATKHGGKGSNIDVDVFEYSEKNQEVFGLGESKNSRRQNQLNTDESTLGGNENRQGNETTGLNDHIIEGKKSVDDTIKDNDLRFAVDDEITDDLFSFDGDLFEEDNTKYLDEYIKTSPQEAVLSMYNSLAKTGESVFRQISTAITNSLDFRH